MMLTLLGAIAKVDDADDGSDMESLSLPQNRQCYPKILKKLPCHRHFANSEYH